MAALCTKERPKNVIRHITDRIRELMEIYESFLEHFYNISAERATQHHDLCITLSATDRLQNPLDNSFISHSFNV